MTRSVVGSAVGIVLGVFTINPAVSSAASIVFDTSAASVTCQTLIGTATVKPAITSASTGAAVIKVKAILNGCVVTGATPSQPTIVSGAVSGTLTTAGSPGCAGLLSPAVITGNLVAKWKVASGQKLDFSSTTAAGGTITGGVFTPGVPFTGSYGQFTVAGQTLAPSSAFAGGAPSTIAITGEDIGYLAGACAGAPPGKGISTIHLSIGQTTL